MVAAGCLLLVMGVFGKIGAAFATIPTPVIGGMFLVMFGVITAVGISNLQVRLGGLRRAAGASLERGQGWGWGGGKGILGPRHYSGFQIEERNSQKHPGF